MDVTGFFPTKPIPYLREGYEEGMERKLLPPFYEDNYTVSPDNSTLSDINLSIDSQWMYHAIVQVILAHNILRNDNRIDSNKIGICGISWGGVITSIALGYDTRFAFAIPIYGSGYLGHGYGCCCDWFRKPNAVMWLAEKRFCHAKMPIMWLCWNDDCSFSINSNAMSYLETRKNNANTCISMLHEMGHSHAYGYTPSESYWFADEVINGNKIPKVCAEYVDGKVLYCCTVPVRRVRLFYITSRLSYIKRDKYGEEKLYMEQDWEIVELDPNKKIAILPDCAVGKYVEFTLEQGIVLTTPYNE